MKILKLILLSLLVCSCAYAGNRFEKIYEQHGICGTEKVIILKDNKTGVEYISFKDGLGAGLTKLEKGYNEQIKEQTNVVLNQLDELTK